MVERLMFLNYIRYKAFFEKIIKVLIGLVKDLAQYNPNWDLHPQYHTEGFYHFYNLIIFNGDLFNLLTLLNKNLQSVLYYHFMVLGL